MSGAALRQPGGIPNQAVSCLGAPSGACKHHPRTRTPHPPQEVELHQPLLALGRLGSEERSCEPNYIGHWPPLAGENLTIYARIYRLRIPRFGRVAWPCRSHKKFRQSPAGRGMRELPRIAEPVRVVVVPIGLRDGRSLPVVAVHDVRLPA